MRGRSFYFLLAAFLAGLGVPSAHAAPDAPGAAGTGEQRPCETYQAPVLDTRTFDDIHRNLGCPTLFYSRVGTMDFPPKDTDHGKLSLLWAQEEIGADLSRELLDGWDGKHSGKPSRIVPVGVLDVGMQVNGFSYRDLGKDLRACKLDPSKCAQYQPQEHGTNVGNLIVGDLGAAAKARLTRLDDRGAFDKDVREGYDHMAEPGPDHPEVVNMSLGEGELKPAARAALERMSATTIAVHSAGNEYPAPQDSYLAQTNGIVVGSLSPEGLMSTFSSEGSSVTISAPSNFEIETVAAAGPGEPSYRRTMTHFSGTSGAAPLVSGAIANVLSLLPGLTTDEAKVLLRRTAIPTAGFRPSNGKNGAGALNAYGMLRVAAQLKLAGWPANRAALREPVPDAGIFRFVQESADLKARGLAALRQFGCDRQKDAVKLLRTAFFLNPEDPEVRGALAEIYRANGFDAQAAYVEGRTAAETVRGLQVPWVKLTLGIRAGIPPETLIQPASARRAAYLDTYRFRSDETLIDITRHSLQDPDPSVRSVFLSVEPKEYPGWTQMLLARTALESAREPSLRARALHESCIHLAAKFVTPLLALARADSSAEVRQEASGCVATCRAFFAPGLASGDAQARERARGALADCDAIGGAPAAAH